MKPATNTFYRLHNIAFLAATIAFLLFTGCKKKDLTYTISGNIHDASFDNSLAGATVTITATGSSKNDFVKTITTGSDGNYTLTFERVKYTEIKIEVKKTNYFPQSATYTLEDFEINKENTVNFTLDAMAWVKLHFTGDGSKTVKYFRQQGLTGCDECCETGDQYIYNCLDQESLCINKGNDVYQIYYFVLGTEQHGQVEVTTTPFEYTELLVEVD